ncbi:CinA family protein [Aureimonas sp. N4]|uniref:CinA family protein n=1 Tax=Aureimonas sp. N4 TaxID=1638165 RepID=UPI000785ABDF|nr:nicotinamide-nucleotide amidohydrolase family protein [Aureimonas sp. N4]
MIDDAVRHRALAVIEQATARSWTVTAAESCTGGLVASALTSIPGSSGSFGWGFVTYSNLAKQKVLGVSALDLERYGAVSEVVARAMAEGARLASNADLAVAITGIAGPGGGSPNKPVGLVHFAVSMQARTRHHVEQFGDLGRDRVRDGSVIVALDLLLEALSCTECNQAG